MAKRHRSAQKRARQSERRRQRNVSIRTQVKRAVKGVVEEVESQEPGAAKATLAKAIPVLARAGAKGVIHKRAVARRISRLTKKVNPRTGVNAATNPPS